MDLSMLPPWESMLKQMIWQQLGEIRHQNILDFGSGKGETASMLAQWNDVTAVEPSAEAVGNSWREYPYRQLQGSTEQLLDMPDESFDVILCHNVLEYAADREAIVRAFARLLKPGGLLSVVKHNRAGRVMQMAVLLDSLEHANELLDGKNSMASGYGTIRYYEDKDIEHWDARLRIVQTCGIRTFWDLQQKQEKHSDPEWQKRMLELETRVSLMEEYRQIAFFHHLLIRKK